MKKDDMREFAKWMLRKTDKELADAAEAYYRARKDVYYAFKKVKEEDADLVAADALAKASTDYRDALRDKQFAVGNWECLKQSLYVSGFTDNEIDEMLYED